MGTAKRGFSTLLQSNPGPGSYEQRAKMGEAPKYAMRPKTAIIMKGGGPGPGQYNPQTMTVRLRPPSAVMGRQTRDGEFVARTKGMPGPGAYTMQSRAMTARPAYSFGTSKKTSKSDENPGPGSYHLPCTFGNPPGFLMPGRSKEFTYV